MIQARTYRKHLNYHFKKMNKASSDDCVLWPGTIRPDGYGQIKFEGRYVLAHRLVYARHHGLNVRTMGGVVMHSCDNPPCVNVGHLTLGTTTANNADKVAKGRQAKRTTNGMCVLTELQVSEIRRRFKWRCPLNGGKALASEFGVSTAQISRIVNGRRW